MKLSHHIFFFGTSDTSAYGLPMYIFQWLRLEAYHDWLLVEFLRNVL